MQDMLQQANAKFDDSRDLANQLLQEEDLQLRKEELARQKKKEKKINAALTKKAKLEGITAEELKEKLKREEKERVI
jgi:hypothetical protein